MSRTAKPYTRESIARAFAHHETKGTVRHVSPPYVGRPKWIVSLPDRVHGGQRLELTDREAWVLALGLAAGDQHSVGNEAAMVRACNAAVNSYDGNAAAGLSMTNEQKIRRAARAAVEAFLA